MTAPHHDAHRRRRRLTLSRLHWPAALVLCVAMLSLGGTAIALVVTHASGELATALLGGESGVAVLVMALMRGLLSGDAGGDQR